MSLCQKDKLSIPRQLNVTSQFAGAANSGHQFSDSTGHKNWLSVQRDNTWLDLTGQSCQKISDLFLQSDLIH